MAKPRTVLLNLSDNYVKPAVVETMNKEWVLNGRNNDFFQYIIDRYNGSPTNAALINAYVDRIYGRGISIVNAETNAAEYASILSVLSRRELRKIVSDFKLFGSAVMQIRYAKSKERRIAKIEHLDRKMVAPGKINKDGEVDHYFVCDDWTKIHQKEPVRYAAFGYSKDALEIFEIKPYKAGKTYFADPDYIQVLQWAMLEEEIANFSVNHIKNGLSAGWILNFHNGVPEEEVQEEMERRIERKLTGSSNAGVHILNFSDSKETSPTIEAIPQNTSHEQWQFWAGEARQQILTGHRVTSPMLFGVKDNTGLGNNANEMREATEILHETVIRPYQNEIIECLEEILAVNNISSPLKFIPLEDEEKKDQAREEAPQRGEQEEEQANEVQLSAHLNTALDILIENGEEVGEDWEVVDERAVDCETITEETINNVLQLASLPKGDSRKSSEQDTSLFKIRYKYAGNPLAQREFCRKLILSGKVYRAEDLKSAENSVVNAGFGPKGTDKYSIWLYKGGVNCNHWWQRIIYLKKGNTRIGVNEARRLINTLEPSERNAAKWTENDPKVAQSASESNNYWKL